LTYENSGFLQTLWCLHAYPELTVFCVQFQPSKIMTNFFQDCDILLFLHELYFIRVFDYSTFLLEISSQQSESGVDHNGILV
jgi:hypothetical protein